MKCVVATVSPPEECRGKAPDLKRVDEEFVEPEDRSGAKVVAQPLVLSGHAGGEVEQEWSSGQEICLAVGACIRDLKNAGTLLAWLSIQAVECVRSGPWVWVRKVLYEMEKAAAGHVGPRKAAAFPLRRGETEDVFRALKSASLEEAGSEEFSERWAIDAWLMLCLQSTNGLAGAMKPLAPGGWTKLEARGAAAAKKAVKRDFCSVTAVRCSPLKKLGRSRKGLNLIIVVKRLVCVKL